MKEQVILDWWNTNESHVITITTPNNMQELASDVQQAYDKGVPMDELVRSILRACNPKDIRDLIDVLEEKKNGK